MSDEDKIRSWAHGLDRREGAQEDEVALLTVRAFARQGNVGVEARGIGCRKDRGFGVYDRFRLGEMLQQERVAQILALFAAGAMPEAVISDFVETSRKNML